MAQAMLDPHPAPDGSRRSWWPVLAVLAVLPVLVLLVALAQRNWYPTGDLAQAELRMRSLPRHPPLVGAAGRIADDAGRQGNHPGPLMFWVTWPFYVLLGRSSWAFEAATGLVNAAWLAVAVGLVRRRTASDALTAGFTAVALLLVGGFGLDALTQPWNPWVALMPFLVVVLATWSALDGGRWAPPLAAIAGSYAIQGHVGYAPVVLPLVAVALLATPARALAARRRAPEGEAEAKADGEGEAPWWRTWWPAAAAAVGVGLAAWSGPLVDLVVDHPNNVTKLLDNFGSPDEPPLGLLEGLRMLGRTTSPLGPWVAGNTQDLGTSPWPGFALLAAWGVVAVLVWRSGRAPALVRLDATLLLSLLAGWFALSRVFGAPYLYLFRWTCVLAALVVFTLGWGAAVLAAPALPSTRPPILRLPVAIAAIGVLALATAVRVTGQEVPYRYSGLQAQVLGPETAAQLDRDRRYLVTWEDPTYLGGLGFGLLLDLERRGFSVGTGPEHVTAAERHRVRCAGDYDAVVVVVTGPAAIEGWAERPGTRQIAEVGPADGDFDEAGTLRRLQRVLADQGQDLTPAQVEQRLTPLVLSPDSPAEAKDLARRLVTEGLSAAVFVQDPAPEPRPFERSVRTEACWRER